MEKLRKNWLIALFILAFSSMPMSVNAVPIALDGSWTILGETMDNGDFFTGSWSWDSPDPVRFDVTDLYVVTDVYKVYDFGAYVFNTPLLPDYADLGIGAFDSPPYTTDPDVAWVSEYFSSGSYLFGAGAHEITIKNVSIPSGFNDGTVAFRAIPEPSTLALLGLGLVALSLTRRRQRR